MECELAAARADREHILSRMVTRTVAEEARQRAAAGMREKAAAIVEGPDGVPNVLSDAIDKLPLPRPRFTN
ncbi:hypothetical protein SAMN02982989_3180 [Xaviernesmea oryzae]|uniref:Uncharacterized protein n=1 Tax=Xaviernesmea oryzae TaxID=464029 RepID=A0A1X7FKP0_9HYPH|nr:hypothetical protein SAMN02982989_3180 [Xaviernesmea oryzae]